MNFFKDQLTQTYAIKWNRRNSFMPLKLSSVITTLT